MGQESVHCSEVFVSFQEKHPGLINVIKALKAGYLPKFKWWASIELLQRLLLVGIIAGLPGRTVSIMIIIE